MSELDAILERFTQLPADKQAKLTERYVEEKKRLKFIPNPGPQTQAYNCDADILLYGGQAGGGKSTLLLGLGSQEHQRSIIFRRESSQTDGLEADGKKIFGHEVQYNGSDLEWTFDENRSLKLAGMKDVDDWNKHAGRERDFIGFDEAGEFLLVQISSLMGWNRGPKGQKCRIVFASNPPRSTDGLWMIRWFAPWLDRKFYNPAKPGELRWAIFIDGEPQWVNCKEFVTIDGKEYESLSLTFIPASLKDNPYRDTPEYRARLQSLHEPLRSQLLYGDFSIGLKDNPDQCIPTAWIIAAQERWKPKPPDDVPMCAIGVDASGGGDDPMIMAPRYDGWFAPLIEIPGKDIPMDRAGSFCAGQILSYRRDLATVVIDLGGGYGSSMYEHLRENAVDVNGYKGAEASTRRSSCGKLKFTNKRSAAYWAFREALDPGQPGGSPISLPDDQKLLSDLAAATFESTAHGIKVEPKDHVCKRLGRSTDRGDAVIMSWFEGARAITNAMDWIDLKESRRINYHPKVIGGNRKPLSVRL